MIWMHEYTGVDVNTEFVPNCQNDSIPVVTVLGGTTWGTVYDSLPEVNTKYIGNNCN